VGGGSDVTRQTWRDRLRTPDAALQRPLGSRAIDVGVEHRPRIRLIRRAQGFAHVRRRQPFSSRGVAITHERELCRRTLLRSSTVPMSANERFVIKKCLMASVVAIPCTHRDSHRGQQSARGASANRRVHLVAAKEVTQFKRAAPIAYAATRQQTSDPSAR
jgi:hypothetical protein